MTLIFVSIVYLVVSVESHLWEEAMKEEKNILELGQFDVFGLVNVKSLGGASYFVTFIDDASRKVWAYPMKGKDEVFEIFKNFMSMLKDRLTNYSSA